MAFFQGILFLLFFCFLEWKTLLFPFKLHMTIACWSLCPEYAIAFSRGEKTHLYFYMEWSTKGGKGRKSIHYIYLSVREEGMVADVLTSLILGKLEAPDVLYNITPMSLYFHCLLYYYIVYLNIIWEPR